MIGIRLNQAKAMLFDHPAVTSAADRGTRKMPRGADRTGFAAQSAAGGARRLASQPSHSASDCTETAPSDRPSRETAVAVTGKRPAELRRRTREATGTCGATPDAGEKIPPAGFEPTTFGLGNRRSILLSYGGRPHDSCGQLILCVCHGGTATEVTTDESATVGIMAKYNLANRSNHQSRRRRFRSPRTPAANGASGSAASCTTSVPGTTPKGP